MGDRPPLFRKVTIVGVGLMGGSLGLAIKKYRLAREVVGVSRQQSSLSNALKMRAIDRASHDLKRSVRDADLVILATPVKTIIHLFSLINKDLRRGCLVTDVGSTKGDIVEAAQKHLPPHALFVGSHPLAGSEKKGVNFANPDLFQKSLCLLTQTEKTNRGALERLKNFWTAVGANVKILSCEEHDKILGYISHVPHLLAYGLIGVVPSEYLNYAASGLKDTTRVASSDPDVWKDICMTNADNIVKVLDDLVKTLSSYRKSIVSKDEQGLAENFRKSKNKRDTLENGA